MFVAQGGDYPHPDAIFVRITLIHNPGAGDDDQPGGEELSALMRRHGHSVRYQSGKDKTWTAVLDEPADLFVVAGGDGTVGRVAKKVIGRDLRLAPLPLGTANNISKTLGVTELTLDEIVDGWAHAKVLSFDAGVATGPWGSRYFMEAFGVGLFARTLPVADRSKTLRQLNDADEKVRTAVKMLRDRLHDCPHHRLDLKLDGQHLSGDYVLFEAMNMEFVGPNLYLAPDMDPDDGMLDVVLVTAAERDALEEPLDNWKEGEDHVPDLPRIRASNVELEWTGYPVHIDDEAWPPEGEKVEAAPKTEIELNVEHDAVKFVAPSAA
ncbi:MAG TPA: diacylglycerol kinase family protein [Burkholderiales bacterium]|nr:diacylglycerol kinase family protein [Burkholderiales bacterium]